MLAVGIALFASSATAGSTVQGCDEVAGTIFMDGDFGDIDRFVAGYKPSTHEVHVEGTRKNSSGTSFSSITCHSSSWKQFSSRLRDLPDKVRADAVGMSVGGYGPLPTTMKTVLNGGNGNDRLTGHGGPDDITGAGGEDVLNGLAGDDVIRAADFTPDTVNCGPGQDKAKADAEDDLTSCENVTLVVAPSG
jgi:Ca2+-binding RTX toxin-like protein